MPPQSLSWMKKRVVAFESEGITHRSTLSFIFALSIFHYHLAPEGYYRSGALCRQNRECSSSWFLTIIPGTVRCRAGAIQSGTSCAQVSWIVPGEEEDYFLFCFLYRWFCRAARDTVLGLFVLSLTHSLLQYCHRLFSDGDRVNWQWYCLGRSSKLPGAETGNAPLTKDSQTGSKWLGKVFLIFMFWTKGSGFLPSISHIMQAWNVV